MTRSEIEHKAIQDRLATRKSYEQLRKEQKKAEIVAAYAAFVADPESKTDEFFAMVTVFIKKKLASLHWDKSCADRTVDDLTQATLTELYQTLQNVDVRDFHSYLNRICYRVGHRTIHESREFNAKFIPLFVDCENEDGTVDSDLNPEIFEQAGSVSTVGVFELKRPLKRRRVFPEWIQGTDLKIVQYLREGFKYQKVADILGLTLSGVNHRIERMRIRAVRENEEQDAADVIHWAAHRERQQGAIKSKREAVASKIDRLTAYQRL